MPCEASLSPLAEALLRALAAEPPGTDMSLPRLGKRLGQGASVLMRELARMGEATLGGIPGPGWVHVLQEEGRWMVQLTDVGRVRAEALPAYTWPTEPDGAAG